MVTASSPTSAVVTGAARGIGRAVAERLVAAGHRVVVTDVDAGAVATTAAEIGATGIAQDVRDPASHRTVAEAASGLAPLGVWVNNAGVGWDGDLVALSDEQVRGLVEINLLGVLWGMRAALDAFATGSGAGSLVNVASLSGLGPVPGLSTYAATKAAVVSVTTSVAIEAPAGVDVHAVLPDGVATAMVDAMSDGTGKRLVSSGGRLLTTDEVADAVLGLVGSRRVLRTIPAWRGGAMRASTLAPSLAGAGIALFEKQGRRALRRR
ncbi:SDR family oxidoreductase [Nocardioides sp.]|uniref:SDR family NAD(P)-dependent oxidoreductase n=1 Tax=Nocardioides sp. TaxID=35761 RepID=UPI002718B966|nr:SDR family NAD(P)-dependent oxidoreductase [Nocardioides sp.]MDO9457264.1 SDR family NAD(P)-dependent oxidoreductase [Nocardioides sp.]